ncbi:hypothetical protein JCM11641_004840, partial [Rhodosporidiobolus odoratus]
DVRRPSPSAVSGLSASSSTVPYTDILTTLSSLTDALTLLASSARSSRPPASPPFSRLPAELVARVVEFCQVDDLRLRQATNLALSLTCRTLHLVSQPIFASEIHLFTPQQLERVAARLPRNPADVEAIRTLMTNLKLDEIERQASNDGLWAGRHLVPLVRKLRQAGRLRTLHLDLRHGDADEDRDTEELAEDVASAMGSSSLSYWIEEVTRPPCPALVDVALPTSVNYAGDYAPVNWLFEVGKQVLHLRLGNLQDACLVPSDIVHDSITWIHVPAPTLYHLHTLCIPFFHFSPTDLRTVLLPRDDPASSTLSTLQVTVQIDESEVDLQAFISLFSHLAPSLRHFALRFASANSTGWSAVEYAFVEVLKSCIKLERLELGGKINMEHLFVRVVEAVPTLRSLTILPISSENFDFSHLEIVCCEVSTQLRDLTICAPSLAGRDPAEDWGAAFLRNCYEACEGQCELELRESPVEYDQWASQ